MRLFNFIQYIFRFEIVADIFLLNIISFNELDYLK